MSSLDFSAALPLLVLAVGSMLLLVAGLFRPLRYKLFWTSALCAASWGFSLPFFYAPGIAFEGLVYTDALSFVLYTLILGGTLLTLLFHHGQAEKLRMSSKIDVDVLILLASCGAMVMASGANLIVIFLGFELLSIAVYVLTGLAREERASAEGALKYFILGAFSSAFLLYGMTLVYGATGSMELSEIVGSASSDNLLLTIGLGLILFGFGFKVSLVPFHVWTPDAYQGAPTTIAGYMAAVVKAAAFGTFLRIMYVSFTPVEEVWVGLVWTLAAVTMTIGNLAALRQRSIKRMLAYSSISHAGYILMGFLALDTAEGGQATLFYLFVYSVMTLGAFGVVLLATGGTDAQYGKDDFRSFQGLGWTHPFLGFCMAVSMLSLAGIPPLGGFLGKLYLFGAVVRGGYVGLAIIAALNSVVSLYYYLSVVVTMYFSDKREYEWLPSERNVFAPRVALALVTFATLLVGLVSEECFQIAEGAMASLLS